jgi:hypothetical protein
MKTKFMLITKQTPKTNVLPPKTNVLTKTHVLPPKSIALSHMVGQIQSSAGSGCRVCGSR